MYCRHCGSQIDDKAYVCPKCGCATQIAPSAPADAPDTGFAVFGFFFPLIGAILYLIWRKQVPLKAGSCIKGALIGFLVNVLLLLVNVAVILIGVNAPFLY